MFILRDLLQPLQACFPESMGSDSIDLKLFFLSISLFATLLNLSCLANCVWKSKESDPIDLAKQTLREADNISFADRYC